ncbi:MAG: pyridoxamine 5'-phosphate oxidase family protein [Candidatus Gastranaerophilales bacterium]|nr:pyridoxamine 5'-phosphate oxidase family protein [Candidatus Gastranaerophilales bacterium]
MFRPLRRIKQQLTQEECISVLKNEVRGVLSVLGDNDYPYGLPINYWYSEDENKIYFHGSREGHKIDSIKNCDKVSFCVYDKGIQVEGKIGLDYKSVIVFGRIKPVEDFDKTIYICRKLSQQFDFGDDYIEEEIKKFAKFVMCLELTPDHICGKKVNES